MIALWAIAAITFTLPSSARMCFIFHIAAGVAGNVKPKIELSHGVLECVVGHAPNLRQAAVVMNQTFWAAGHSHMMCAVLHQESASQPECGHPIMPFVASQPESLLLLALNNRRRCWLVLPAIL